MENTNYRGYNIEIGTHSDDFDDPRQWDNVGTMVFFHGRYNIGDNHNVTIEELERKVNSKKYISLPVYMYDHSSITINTTGFSCPWDSGQIGHIIVSKEKIRKRYGNIFRVTKKVEGWIKEMLNDEVKTYDQWLRGEVYYFNITDASGDTVDSCYSFYDEKDCLNEAKFYVDNMIQSKVNHHCEVLKGYIKSDVPLEKRGECPL